MDKGLLEMLEDSDEEFEMFFKTPEQLEKIFENYEEKNLFLINSTKDIEQKVEEIKMNYQNTIKTLDERKENLVKQKSDLLKSIEVKQ